VVLCGSCSTVLCQPSGGRARLTEGCSFRFPTIAEKADFVDERLVKCVVKSWVVSAWLGLSFVGSTRLEQRSAKERVSSFAILV
jgi:Ribosomal protein S27